MIGGNAGPHERFDWDARRAVPVARCQARLVAPAWAKERLGRCLQPGVCHRQGLWVCANHAGMARRGKDLAPWRDAP